MNNSESIINSLPFRGDIEAGKPLQIIKKTSLISVPEHLQTQGNCEVFTLKGNSMIEAGLINGDLLIIEKADNAKNGDIVLALIDNYEATLKRYENTGAITILHPENGTVKPYVFEASRVNVIGILVGQMRCYTKL